MGVRPDNHVAGYRKALLWEKGMLNPHLPYVKIEAGGKNGIFPVDAKAIAYMEEHSKREFKIYEADW